MNSVPLILAVGSAHDHVWPIMCIRNVDGPEWEMLDIELNRCVDISAIQYVGLHALHISYLSVFDGKLLEDTKNRIMASVF
jgi:hypothetical protein